MGRPWYVGVVFLSGIIGWALSGPAHASDSTPEKTPSSFIRFVKTSPREGHVDTAIKTYQRADRIQVSLVAAVHVADAAYYHKLQKRFRSFDAVLYEMVKPQEVPIESRGQADSPISMLQVGMKNVLQLEYQLDAIDYSPANFVHADMDPDSFYQAQNEQGESILGLMIRGVLEEQNRSGSPARDTYDGMRFLLALMSSDRAHSLKFLMAEQLEDMESLLAGVDQGPEGKGSVLVSGRNSVAFQVLDREIARGRRKLAIFYGAGHMPDMEKRLLERGYRPVASEWLVAWDLTHPTE